MSYANRFLLENQYIKSLADLPNAETSLSGLVIADSHRQLLQHARPLLEAGRYAYLAFPQELWAREEDQWCELLRWSIRELRLESIVLIGTTEPSFIGHDHKTGKTARDLGGSITNTLRQAQSGRMKAQRYFVDRYTVFSEVVRQEASAVGVSTVLDGLVYRPESGVFASYDPETDKLQALLPTQSVQLQI